ncbi:glycosyltransferase [Thiomicrorhabdus sp.]|uniref:glycosyltransferase n=1 Tax=Thiomicrorhabdus sp. TaxID=2039724 RepID=UPI0035639C5C
MSDKILHIINGEFFAGAERVQDLLAMNLPELGFDVEFICLKEGEFNKRRKSTSPSDVFQMSSKFDFGVSKRIIDHIRDKNFKIVHTHTARSALIGRKVAKSLNIPLIHHQHSPTLRDTENPFRNFLNAFIEDKLVLPNVDHFIPVSLSLKDYLIEHGVAKSKITPVFNGVPIVNDKVNWMSPQNGEWVIGTVALFRPRKGLEVLLKSIHHLKSTGTKVKLKAVGTFETPQYEQTIKDMAKDLGITELIEWTGFSSDVHKEMKDMHLFVLPSLFGEGLPMVVIEAMSMGIPVVSTEVEGIPDVLENGLSGEIVLPNDEHSLTNGILNYINNKKEPDKTAARALERQANYYSDKAMAKGVAQVYSRLIHTHGKP